MTDTKAGIYQITKIIWRANNYEYSREKTPKVTIQHRFILI